MSRVLVVHPDPLVTWDRAAALEHAGYEVLTCDGPEHTDCPILRGDACPLLDVADVLLYDASIGPPQEMGVLVASLRETYADLPLVIVGAHDAESWAPAEGTRRVWAMPEVGSIADLAGVLEAALSEQGMAV